MGIALLPAKVHCTPPVVPSLLCSHHPPGQLTEEGWGYNWATTEEFVGSSSYISDEAYRDLGLGAYTATPLEP